MRGVGAISKILLVAALAVMPVGCSDQPPDPFGAIHIVAGPHSDLIVARGQYHLRADFPITPFAYGPSMYVPIDSVQAQAVLRFADFDGVTTTIDSLDPGAYSLLVYVSRLSVNQVTPDTNVIEGDTVITDPTDAMGPYDYYFRPIFVDDIRIAADSTAQIDLSDQLEPWQAVKQTADGGWQVERVRYLPWAGEMAGK